MALVTLESGEGLRPYKLNNKRVQKIVFFRDGKELLTIHQGWLESLSDRDIRSITIEEPKKAIKTDLSRKYNFFVTDKSKSYFDEGYTLYLYVDGENIQLEKFREMVIYDTDIETAYCEVFNVVLPHVTIFRPIKGPNFEFDNRDIEWTTAFLPSFEMKGGVTRRERKPLGLELDALMAQLEKHKINITSYDALHLLKHFNVTPKV